MGPHGICMRFVFRNMLTLSLSLSIGVAEATPRQQRRVPVPATAVRRFSSGETPRDLPTSCFIRYSRSRDRLRRIAPDIRVHAPVRSLRKGFLAGAKSANVSWWKCLISR
jgi:hypothetical protein